MSCNSACVRDFREIFRASGGVFWDAPSNDADCIFSPTDPRCHGNEIWDKIGYNSPRVRDFLEIFAPIGGFSGMGHRMLPIAFFPRPTPVAMATKFGTKVAITRLVQEIFARFVRL